MHSKSKNYLKACMINSLETSEEKFKNMESNTYSKAGGILNIKDLNTVLVFPKYLFIYQHNSVSSETHICIFYYKKLEVI